MIDISIISLGIFAPISVLAIFFWLWMLIDCLNRSDGKFKIGGNNAKLIWILVIIFTWFIGALIYYIFIKRGDHSEEIE